MTSPAEELRSAAVLLRQRATAAPKGPWAVEYFGDAGYPQRITNAQATLIATTHEGGTGLRPIPEYIRLMHPLVGLALADLLDRFAAMFDAGALVAAEFGVEHAAIQRPYEPQALALARLVLAGGGS